MYKNKQGMSILESKDIGMIADFHKKQMDLILKSIEKKEVCTIKGCDRPAVEKWRDISEMYNICEYHEEIFLKALGQD